MKNNRKRTATLKQEHFDTSIGDEILKHGQKRPKVEDEDGIDNCMNDLLDKSKQLDVNVGGNSSDFHRKEVSMDKVKKGNFGAKLYKSGKLVCYDCKKTFSTKPDFDLHIATEHDKIDQTPLQERINVYQLNRDSFKQEASNHLQEKNIERVEMSSPNEMKNFVGSNTEDLNRIVAQLMKEKIGESVGAIQIDVNAVFHLLKIDMKKKDEELKNLIEEKKDLNEALANANNVLNIKDATIVKKDEKIKNMKESLSAAKQMLNTERKDEEVQNLKKEKKDLITALMEAQKVLNIKDEAIIKKEEQVENMKESLSAAKQMLIQKVTSAAKTIELHVKQNEELMKENKKLKEEVQQMEELETENVILKENLKQQEEKLSAAETEMKNLNQELEQMVKDHQSKSMEMIEKNKTNKKVIEMLEKENVALKKKCSKRKIKLKKAQKLFRSVENRLRKSNPEKNDLCSSQIKSFDFEQKHGENFKMRELREMEVSKDDSTKGELKPADINGKILDIINARNPHEDKDLLCPDSEKIMDEENVDKIVCGDDLHNKEQQLDAFKHTLTEDNVKDKKINFEGDESSIGQPIKTEKSSFVESTHLEKMQSRNLSLANQEMNTQSNSAEKIQNNPSQNNQNDTSKPAELEIFEFNGAVTESVKECLLKYYNCEETKQQSYTIKEKEDFIELCRMFSYRFRKEVKDSFVEFNGTTRGICLTMDDKEYIKDQIEQYFKFNPLKPGRRLVDGDL